MRLLVTGATGFIGRRCMALLHDRDVHSVTSRALPRSGGGATWHKCDLHDPEQVSALIDDVRPSHLLHLAWYAHPALYWRSIENFRWVASTTSLLLAFARHGRRAVVAGTSAEYDWSLGVLSEDVPASGGTTVYGSCKDASRRLLVSLAGETGMEYAWGRIFAAYGPGEPPDKLVSLAIRRLAAGEPVRVPTLPIQRDFVFVDDVARAFVFLLDNPYQGVINIGTGIPRGITEVVDCVASELNVETHMFPDPQLDREAPLVAAETVRLRGLGWEPRHDLRSGIRETVAALRPLSSGAE